MVKVPLVSDFTYSLSICISDSSPGQGSNTGYRPFRALITEANNQSSGPATPRHNNPGVSNLDYSLIPARGSGNLSTKIPTQNLVPPFPLL